MQEINISRITKLIENKKVLVAVSGGVDSMVLLDLLSKMHNFCSFCMEIIHINHNLRGEESDKDAKLVQNTANRLKINCKIISIDVEKFKKENKQTIEQAARELRYKEIYEYKEKNNFDYVIIAHNSDDQAETILMHICRGCGLNGARGIGERKDLLRPLLNVSKSAIIKYAEENEIEYREDLSNRDIKYTRNYIRNEILPKLEEIYPNVKQNLVNFAEIVKNDDDFILNNIDYSLIKAKNKDVYLNLRAFENTSTIYSRLIYNAINMLGVFSDIEQKHVKMIYDLSFAKNGSYLVLPHGINVYKEYDCLVFTQKKQKNAINIIKKYQVGEVLIDNYKITIEEVSSDDIVFGDGNLYFDLDSIPYDAVFRHKQNGDIFQKLNSGSKKFSDYLTDKKVPLKDRSDLIVLAIENKILLCLTLDISDSIKVTSTTQRIGKLSFVKK